MCRYSLRLDNQEKKEKREKFTPPVLPLEVKFNFLLNSSNYCVLKFEYIYVFWVSFGNDWCWQYLVFVFLLIFPWIPQQIFKYLWDGQSRLTGPHLSSCALTISRISVTGSNPSLGRDEPLQHSFRREESWLLDDVRCFFALSPLELIFISSKPKKKKRALWATLYFKMVPNPVLFPKILFPQISI